MVSRVKGGTSTSTWPGHTIEAVVELAARLELCARHGLGWKKSMQGQAEEVVAKGCKGGFGVDQSRDTRPANFPLELVKIQTKRMEQGRGRTARDVVAEEGKGIAHQRQDDGNDQGSRAGRRAVSIKTRSIGRRTYGPRNS